MNDSKKILLLALLFISAFVSYTLYLRISDDQLNGHWHIFHKSETPNPSSHLRALIDFQNGIGYWNKGVEGYSGLKMETNVMNNRFFIDPLFSDISAPLDVEIEEDTMRLTNIDRPNEFYGYKCNFGCCDKQKDFFLNLPKAIDLPFKSNTSITKNHEFNIFENKIFIYNSPTIFFYNYKILDVNIENISLIKETHAVKIPDAKKHKITYSFYADKKIKISDLKNVLSLFKNSGIDIINLVTRNNKDVMEKLSLNFKPINLEMLKEIDNEVSIQDWINEDN